MNNTPATVEASAPVGFGPTFLQLESLPHEPPKPDPIAVAKQVIAGPFFFERAATFIGGSDASGSSVAGADKSATFIAGADAEQVRI